LAGYSAYRGVGLVLLDVRVTMQPAGLALYFTGVHPMLRDP